MISIKMKEDAARINSEIKIIGTKMPLVFHNYNYLNEDHRLVLKRRNDQLNEMKGVKDFLNGHCEYGKLLNDCETKFKNIDEHLEQLRMGRKVDDAYTTNADQSQEDSEDLETFNRQNITISRENSAMPDTPALSCNRKRLYFSKKF